MNALYKTLCVRSSAQMHSARTERSREAAAQRESLVRANSYTLWRGYQSPAIVRLHSLPARAVLAGAVEDALVEGSVADAALHAGIRRQRGGCGHVH